MATKAKPRGGRNRTLVLDEKEQESYLQRCLKAVPPGEDPRLDVVYQGDAFALLSQMPHGFVDLLIVDPPYNLAKTYGDNRFKKQSPETYRALTESWLDLVLPLLAPRASVYVCCDWASSLMIAPLLQERLLVQNRITWQREKGRGAKRNWKNAMEDIWFATVDKDYVFNLDAVKQRRRVLAPYRQEGKPKDWQATDAGNFRDTHPSNFWDDLTVPYWSMAENTQHPTQKPEKLMAKLILASSQPGQVVLDPFAGSGTTAVVAQKLGRRFVAIEQEPVFCALAQKRLELAQRETRIQGYVDGVFWERNTLHAQKEKLKAESEGDST